MTIATKLVSLNGLRATPTKGHEPIRLVRKVLDQRYPYLGSTILRIGKGGDKGRYKLYRNKKILLTGTYQIANQENFAEGVANHAKP